MTSPAAIGRLIRDARKQRGLTQHQLAEALSTSQSAIHRIEAGNQNLSLEMINRIADALESPLIAPAKSGTMNYRIRGGRPLSGSIAVRSSKNAAVALLCASLLNHGQTVLSGIARIEEVKRILEVLVSMGVSATWNDDFTTLTLVRPERLQPEAMDVEAARRTRSQLLVIPALATEFDHFRLPYAGGCDLGARTIEPHVHAFRNFGLTVSAHNEFYDCHLENKPTGPVTFTMTERGDTATENALLIAATYPGTTVIRNASPNYMVQDLCVFLRKLGVSIEGIGTTTLTVVGQERIEQDIEYAPSEDPIEAMSLLTAAIVTESELTLTRVPIEFLEIELATLYEMGLQYELSPEYPSNNDFTRLVDLTVKPSQLTASKDKIHPMPFPGLNIDNLPFFAVISAHAQGQTMIHDWVFENRAIHLLELTKLGATVQLLDPHRLIVQGPTRWRARDMTCPPALRPAMCLMLAALAAPGDSILRDVYMINRGYEDLPRRLNALGADVEVFYE